MVRDCIAVFRIDRRTLITIYGEPGEACVYEAFYRSIRPITYLVYRHFQFPSLVTGAALSTICQSITIGAGIKGCL